MKKIIIKPDSNPESPREWDNMTEMICFHRKYSLGDNNPCFQERDFSSFQELHDEIHRQCNVAAILPMYLYDHSGLSISTKQFDCRWDSGQVGFIFITKETMIENFGGKNLTVKMQQKAVEICESDVKTYDQYLSNEVYRFEIIESREMVSMSKQDWEAGNCDNVEHFVEDFEIDSCGGFYGNNWFENGMSDHIPEELHELLKTTEITYE